MDQSFLSPLIAQKLLERGASVQIAGSKLLRAPLDAMVEYAKPNFLIASVVLSAGVVVNLIGSTVTIRLETETAIFQITLEVVQEQLVWPIKILGMLPVNMEMLNKEDMPLVKPDFIINVPYNVMGAKPVEEKGEAVLLQFSPYKLLIGTDGFLSKGDFIHLNFVVPRANLELVAMAKVEDKQFVDGSAKVHLTFTDIEPKFRQILLEYYQKLHRGK